MRLTYKRIDRIIEDFSKFHFHIKNDDPVIENENDLNDLRKNIHPLQKLVDAHHAGEHNLGEFRKAEIFLEHACYSW